MIPVQLSEKIILLIRESGPLTTKEIVGILQKHKIQSTNKEINSVLYGQFRELVVRDLNERGLPVWRIRGTSFSAAKGLEVKLYQALLKNGIIRKECSELDYLVEDKKKKKKYHLDIAFWTDNHNFVIEVDGFEHIRADARLSIQRQLKQKKKEIDIDWMDNERSYVDFKQIENRRVLQWCTDNLAWCRRYHEELIWPDDIKRNIFLLEQGWKVMRLWNIEVRSDLNRCLREIKEWVGQVNKTG